MSEIKVSLFAKERDEAFADFVMTDSTEKLFGFMKKYKMQKPKDEKILKAGIYKAVQECTKIPEEVKTVAMQKCLKLGFSPFINWGEEDG